MAQIGGEGKEGELHLVGGRQRVLGLIELQVASGGVEVGRPRHFFCCCPLLCAEVLVALRDVDRPLQSAARPLDPLNSAI